MLSWPSTWSKSKSSLVLQVSSFWQGTSAATRADGSISMATGTFSLIPDVWNDVMITVKLNSIEGEDVKADGVLQVRGFRRCGGGLGCRLVAVCDGEERVGGFEGF